MSSIQEMLTKIESLTQALSASSKTPPMAPTSTTETQAPPDLAGTLAEVLVEEGKTVTIEIRADNYETETLTLDGSETSKMVKLKRPAGKLPLGPLKPPTDKGSKKGTNGGTDVRDPWKNK